MSYLTYYIQAQIVLQGFKLQASRVNLLNNYTRVSMDCFSSHGFWIGWILQDEVWDLLGRLCWLYQQLTARYHPWNGFQVVLSLVLPMMLKTLRQLAICVLNIDELPGRLSN